MGSDWPADVTDHAPGSRMSAMTPNPLRLTKPADDLDRFLDRVADSPRERLRTLNRLLGEQACRQLGIFPLPEGFKLSVVIPVYNEEQWVAELVRRVRAVPLPKEIVLVDDCSTDGTRAILSRLEMDDDVRVVYQPHNQGKG